MCARWMSGSNAGDAALRKPVRNDPSATAASKRSLMRPPRRARARRAGARQQRRHHAARETRRSRPCRARRRAGCGRARASTARNPMQDRTAEQPRGQPLAAHAAEAIAGHRIAALADEARLHAPRVPIQTTSQPRARSSSATARPGKTCPPVPPAMMSDGLLIACSPLASWRFSQSMRSRIASATQLTTQAASRRSSCSGSVRPLVGSRPMFTPMLMNA